MSSSIRKITLKTAVTVIQSCGFFLSCGGARVRRGEWGGVGGLGGWGGVEGFEGETLGRFGGSGAGS